MLGLAPLRREACRMTAASLATHPLAAAHWQRPVSRTFDLSAPGFRSSAVRVVNNACKGVCSETLPARVVRRVPITCPTTQTHQPTARIKKTCKRRPFRKRLKGFEPSTFCMGSPVDFGRRGSKRATVVGLLRRNLNQTDQVSQTLRVHRLRLVIASRGPQYSEGGALWPDESGETLTTDRRRGGRLDRA
jgi:hypothetical protein